MALKCPTLFTVTTGLTATSSDAAPFAFASVFRVSFRCPDLAQVLGVKIDTLVAVELLQERRVLATVAIIARVLAVGKVRAVALAWLAAIFQFVGAVLGLVSSVSSAGSRAGRGQFILAFRSNGLTDEQQTQAKPDS